MSSTDATAERTAFEYDVVIVGGGPAGCSAGVFTARYGLETAIFDRGNSSIRRCAHLGNYLGFPAGIDVETFYGLIHDHAEEAGCTVIADMVESVERTDGGGFLIETQDGRTVRTERVVAAARYDAEYLRPLGDGKAMFETHEHGGETHEQFDREYPNEDGTTPIDGVYVAAPATDAEAQAITSAGHGARVGRTVLADVRRDRGFPDTIAEQYDWIRRESDLSGEWADRGRWREWFDERVPDDHDLDEERFLDLRERELDRKFDAYLSTSEIERRTERAQRRLLDHLDDELVLETAREIEAERERREANE
ncbi:NAD(P)/FAD-dependent oxidoreductase [Halalkalicoccus subterraneus]|uniref:NAD(P)/FAD-dependent oxidoreductase n=1 Tax=Halalkalicoccus subterraneus TaxID=2675002 RepID=UPI000EFC03A5|nr:FAD-dependent oxidoreductase [Halalkalicoccus subterraneus]